MFHYYKIGDVGHDSSALFRVGLEDSQVCVDYIEGRAIQERLEINQSKRLNIDVTTELVGGELPSTLCVITIYDEVCAGELRVLHPKEKECLKSNLYRAVAKDGGLFPVEQYVTYIFSGEAEEKIVQVENKRLPKKKPKAPAKNNGKELSSNYASLFKWLFKEADVRVNINWQTSKVTSDNLNIRLKSKLKNECLDRIKSLLEKICGRDYQVLNSLITLKPLALKKLNTSYSEKPKGFSKKRNGKEVQKEKTEVLDDVDSDRLEMLDERGSTDYFETEKSGSENVNGDVQILLKKLENLKASLNKRTVWNGRDKWARIELASSAVQKKLDSNDDLNLEEAFNGIYSEKEGAKSISQALGWHRLFPAFQNGRYDSDSLKSIKTEFPSLNN